MAKTFGFLLVIPFENPFYKWNADNKYRQAEKIIENILETYKNVVCIKSNIYLFVKCAFVCVKRDQEEYICSCIGSGS